MPLVVRLHEPVAVGFFAALIPGHPSWLFCTLAAVSIGAGMAVRIGRRAT